MGRGAKKAAWLARPLYRFTDDPRQLAWDPVYAKQAMHCEESHNSTFNKVHLIACPPCVLQYKLDICPQLHGGGGGVRLNVGWSSVDWTSKQPGAVGGNLEDHGDTAMQCKL